MLVHVSTPLVAAAAPGRIARTLIEFTLKCPSPMGPAPILKTGIGRPFL
jgi:hypothetical protein